MDRLLFALTLLSLLIPGWALVTLLGPRRDRLSWLEVGPLAFLLGSAAVTLTSFALGFLVAGGLLRGLVVVMGLLFSLGVVARYRGRPTWDGLPRGPVASLALLVLTAQVTAVVWLAWRGTLEWDGLAVWEIKAYLACLNDGRIPLAYFSDPSRQWSHPQYPLFVPLLETWLYGWLGRCDQRLAGMLFPLFYPTAAGLLLAGGLRLGKRLGAGLAAALLLFCVPQLVVSAGSAASGYADFPLAVFYLGALVYLADYAVSGEAGRLRLAVALAACLPWIKQDGLVLALAFFLLTGGVLWRQRRTRVSLLAPPVVFIVYGVWTAFLALANTPPSTVFLPFTLGNLVSHLDRLGPILLAVVKGMLLPWQWSLLWAALPVALWLLARRVQRPPVALLALSVVLPLAAYSVIYIFSAWTPYSLHVDSSLPRLLSHVALVALLLVGLAMPERATAGLLEVPEPS